MGPIPACLLLLAAALSLTGRNLEVFFIDVEGGKATLIISPLGESLLIDAGLDGFNNRDADRIAAAAKLGGVTRIDNLVITHYHVDHVGGVRQLAAKFADYQIFLIMGRPSMMASEVNGSTAHTNKSLQGREEIACSLERPSR